MSAELGHFTLILALMIAIVQIVFPLIGAHKNWHSWMRTGSIAAQIQFLLIGISFVMLTIGFVTSDFSYWLVANNSHSTKPLIYKISGVWGNHEGSMLLWILILALFGALVAIFGNNLPDSLKARVLAVQGMIGAAFTAFILFTSNPFLRLSNPPLDGSGLNPLLQDPGLAFHPPLLYVGYVGLSTSFSFAVAALIEGKVDAAWARWVRPWTLAAWISLTLGIGLGSWWAYYELGWGGWWFWDPVENASFMPWLIAAALLHSAIVVEKRDALKSWTVLLAILAFSFSLIGTFIVRSGLLTSVHAFATDPERGVFILAILFVAIGGALTLYAVRAPTLKTTAVFGVASRETGLVINNLLLTVSAAVVFIGTVWPLIAEMLTGAKLSVGAPFFNLAFTPFVVFLALLLPLGAMLPWKRAKLGRVIRQFWAVAVLAIAIGIFVWAVQTGGRMLAPVGVALASWVTIGVLREFSLRVRLFQIEFAESVQRARHLPKNEWGKYVAHIGFGLTIFGVATISAWELEDIRTMEIGDTTQLGKYEIRFDGVEQYRGPNYVAQQGIFVLLEGGARVGRLVPEKRIYPVEGMPTTEAAIDQGITRDVYVVLGDQQNDGSWAVRSYIKPFANWIWIGVLVMSLGGVISLMDRRYRVAVPVRSKNMQAQT